MTKNITVTDEFGNLYTPTYRKRARGLVKRKRAYFLDEHTICLLRPPDNKEETFMEQKQDNITAIDILDRIDTIIQDTEYLRDKITNIEATLASKDFDSSTMPEVLQILNNTIVVKETTNQQIIALLKKMYDDIRPPRDPETLSRLSCFTSLLEKKDMPAEDLKALLENLSNQVF